MPALMYCRSRRGKSLPRVASHASASASSGPRSSAPASQWLACHMAIATRSRSCHSRNVRSSAIHVRSCSQCWISASWATSTVSPPPSSLPVVSRRSPASCCTSPQFSSPTSSRVARRRVSAVPMPGRTNWTNTARDASCSAALSRSKTSSACCANASDTPPMAW